MYRIKKDKRQIESSMRLIGALTQCLQHSSMSEIGVSDLCKVAEVSRSTFYRMFDTPVDLLEYTCDRCIAKAIEDYSEEVFTKGDDFVLYSLMYWKNHTDLLEAAVNCGRMDLIRKSFENHSEKVVPYLDHEFSEMEKEYIESGMAGLVTSLLFVWIRRGRKETPSDLFDLYCKFYRMIRKAEG